MDCQKNHTEMFTVKELIKALKKADQDAPVAYGEDVQGGTKKTWLHRVDIERGCPILKQ